MTPKYLLSISVLGWFCLYFTTPIHANQSLKETLHDLPQQILHVSDLAFGETNQDAQVQDLIDRYAHDWDYYTEKLFGKAIYHFPIFSHHLEAADVPDALKYLPLIESHLVPDAESPRGAKGLWQFMPATAQHYGLRVDEEVDERLDPQLASAAAAKMLRELFDTFGDWKLVLAAYNCGPGRVKRAITKAQSKRYEDLRPYLPRQTQQYLQRFTAMLYLGEHAQDLGLEANISEAALVKNWEQVSVSASYDLKQIAELAGLNYTLLLGLNPGLSSTENGRKLLLPDYAAQRLNTLSEKVHGRNLEELSAIPTIHLADLVFCGEVGASALGLDIPLLPDEKSPARHWQELIMSWVVLPRLSLLS